jgi:hypothetical protein
MSCTVCTEPQCLYSRAIPLLPLWAVRPVQSLSACTVQLYLYSLDEPYGLYRASVPVQRCILPFYVFFKQYESYKKVQAAVDTRKMKSLVSSCHKNKALSTTGQRSDGAANLLLTRVDMSKKVWNFVINSHASSNKFSFVSQISFTFWYNFENI